MEKKIDIEQYTILQEIYVYFNHHLFSDFFLPEIIFTIDYRKSNNNGFFHAEKFDHNGKKISVISLNPDHFNRSNIDCMSTIAHEMSHLWEYCISPDKYKGGYHTKVWSSKMQKIGLMPSDTGQEGGKKTGRRMTHYIVKNGLFEQKANEFISNHQNIFLFSGIAMIQKVSDKKRNKIKYTCPCGQNVWGKPDLQIICGECKQYFA